MGRKFAPTDLGKGAHAIAIDLSIPRRNISYHQSTSQSRWLLREEPTFFKGMPSHILEVHQKPISTMHAGYVTGMSTVCQHFPNDADHIPNT